MVSDIDILSHVPFGKGPLRLSQKSSLRITSQSGGDHYRRLMIRTSAVAATIQVDVFYADQVSWPYAMLHHTGPKAYNIRLRAHAKRKGLKLNQYGLWKKDGSLRVTCACRTEKQVTELLGVTYRTPKHRADVE